MLGGCAAVEKAAKAAGVDVKVPFTPGRTDASQEQTDVESFAPLEPRADGFRNYIGKQAAVHAARRGSGGPRAAAAADGTGDDGAGRRSARARRECRRLEARRLARKTGALTNEFFVNLLDMSTEWQPAGDSIYEGRDRKTKAAKWTGPAST